MCILFNAGVTLSDNIMYNKMNGFKVCWPVLQTFL